MFTIWVILCQCGIFKICKKKKKKKTRTLSMLCFSVSCFFLIALFSWEMIYTTRQSLIFLCFFFFRLHYKPTSRCPGNEPASPHEKNSSRGKTRPDRGSDENQAYFLLHSSFFNLVPREAKEKESARGTMGRRKVIASSYWDTQQELRRENHPCGTFLDCYDF